MLREKLNKYHIILASGSPRRQHFFRELNLEFAIEVRTVEEVYPPSLKGAEITDYLAQLKASVFVDLKASDLLITSDTIVWKDGRPLEKPLDRNHAIRMLKDLSGEMHEVFTSVCFTTKHFQETINDRTKVWFRKLNQDEIEYYVDTYKPFDKAGSYGIQDWLGYVGIEKLKVVFSTSWDFPPGLFIKR